MEKLLLQIEQCRKEMIALSNNYNLTSDIVVETSKKLDCLLNKYHLRATYQINKKASI